MSQAQLAWVISAWVQTIACQGDCQPAVRLHAHDSCEARAYAEVAEAEHAMASEHMQFGLMLS